ncbi:hypothetical protein BB560_005007, partial [Smittium megazygosporum]
RHLDPREKIKETTLNPGRNQQHWKMSLEKHISIFIKALSLGAPPPLYDDIVVDDQDIGERKLIKRLRDKKELALINDEELTNISIEYKNKNNLIRELALNELKNRKNQG